MGRFNLALDSAYVVQAMRLSPQNADRVKLKLYLSVAVIVLHLLALFALMRWTSQPVQARLAAGDSETVVVLESESTEPDSPPAPEPVAQAPVPKTPTPTPTPKVIHPTPVRVTQPLPVRDHRVPAEQMVSSPASTASSQVSGVQSNTASSSSSSSGSGAGQGSTQGAGTASVAECSTLVGFNRRYPGLLQQNSTVLLHMTRNANGSVSTVSLARSSGDSALDQFALNSARNARFKANAGCAQRAFNLPILFKAR